MQIGDRVRIVKGSHAGEFGNICHIYPGRGGDTGDVRPYFFTIKLDSGKTSGAVRSRIEVVASTDGVNQTT